MIDDDDWADLLARMGESPMPQPDPPIKPPIPGREPFVHLCACGKWGSFGYGVDLRAGKEGKWYCREHRPVAHTSPA